MRKLGRDRFVSRLARAPVTYIVLIIFSLLFVWSAFGAYHKSRLAKKKMLETGAELANLEEQKGKLSVDLANANTPFGEEKALREKFNVVRPGEEVIIITPEEKKEEGEEKGGGFFRFFKKLFTEE